MTYFLTSSPCVAGALRLNPANGFVKELKKALPGPCDCLFLCSDPDSPVLTDRFGGEMRRAFEDAGFRFTSYTILDRRNAGQASGLAARSGLVILGGGHVPTQNRFFREIGLARLLKGYAGVLVGISAGSMNAAEEVYAIPEYPEEVTDPAYERFLPGLGITRVQILPHYNENKDEVLSGLHIYREIACPDSVGRVFTALPDGSYLYGHDGMEELRGEAYRVSDGTFEQICWEEEIRHV